MRLFCKDVDLTLKELLKGDITVSDTDADFFIIEKGHMIDSVIGEINDEFTILKPEDILFVESYGNDVYCQTLNEQYEIREKLFEFELMFHLKGFIRVNKSYVININHIKKIRPSINMKYSIEMINGFIVDVTRTYYYAFKDYIGL